MKIIKLNMVHPNKPENSYDWYVKESFWLDGLPCKKSEIKQVDLDS